jgi:biopolymer transport protein ExbB
VPVVLIVTAVLEKLVLFILLGLSVWSVSIMISAQRKFRKFNAWSPEASTQIELLIRRLDWAALKMWAEQHAELLTAGAIGQALLLTGGDPELVDRTVKSFLTREKMRLEKGLSVLATLGANAPFIGLFGTVLGIIRSFAALADNQGNATNVMSGISQALYATAAGLFVAIPAVIAYNTFASRLRSQLMSADALKDLYLAYRGQK